MARAALLLVLALLPQQVPRRTATAPLASGVVRSLELEAPPGTWVQHLRLDHARARADDPPAALLRYVAGPDPRGGLRVELELEYLDEALRVIHTEQANRARRRLVFRELHANGGRTLFLEGSPEAGYEGYELGVREEVRHAFGGDGERAAGELPLLVVEAARTGFPPPEEAALLDPLGARFEPVRLALAGDAAARACEIRRADGSLRWRVTFAGARIAEWRFQERGPSARAIPSEEHARLREEHDLAVRAAREAASARPRARLRPDDSTAPRTR